MNSNFDFLKLEENTAGLYRTLNSAEKNYVQEDYEGCFVKIRKIAEEVAYKISTTLELKLPEHYTFNDILKVLFDKIPKFILDKFYNLKLKGNISAHVVNASEISKEDSLEGLFQIYYILVWYVKEFVNPKISKEIYSDFSEPVQEKLYSTAERKFIYVQTVNNESNLFPAYKDTQKIGEGTIPEDNIEANWEPNSDFLRREAPKRINQYMTTAGLEYNLGWVELAYIRSQKKWFHDYDVHNVLKRSGIQQSDVLKGKEWFKTDLNTAKLAIKAVKEGKSSLLSDSVVNEEMKNIVLRPEQKAAITQTQKIFKHNNKMLWNAKMRFGKTLTALQLIKDEGFKKVLIMTHRPVVSDSWFSDFKKMDMLNAGYRYGSVDKGEKLDYLKSQKKPFIYFASIQLLRYNNGRTNLQEYTSVDWDLIIIDEAHEGTQTEQSEYVLNSLKRENTKILELSGTPFNILENFKEDEVFTWDYTMEQEAKLRWSVENPTQPNPYENLPKVNMYTFEMINKQKFSDETKSFNFREFFKLNDDDNFYYHEEVKSFLDNITNFDKENNYPFSTQEYRDELRHTLWILPGVKEANAFEEMLNQHPVFGSEYKVVNVVKGSNEDDGITREGDIDKVRKAIGMDPSKTKTITLTVRKLTTGVNVPEWTAVLFLSNTSSAMNYLQAAFRAQTPFSHEKLGRKENCYIFDFAPDRALSVLAESAQINSGVGKKNTQQQKDAMTRLLNFLPILGSAGNEMKTYDVDMMLVQLKRVYAEKAVRSGFDDDSIYNDKLLTLTSDDVNLFKKLNAIVGKSNKTATNKKIAINDNGLTDEEYDKGERARKKNPRNRTQEEIELIKKIQEARKQRKSMISILRGVSIRIPLMIYGMRVDIEDDITIEQFTEHVDNDSWNEFMPDGFSKEMFKKISVYYDAEVFIEAGRIIRRKAKSFDNLDFIDRADSIANLFSTFKNPDKETVLTPWRVVNIQLSTTIGGLNFFDDNFEYSTTKAISNLHWVNHRNTQEIFNMKTRILEINSKTGLYPLYAAISMYYKKIIENDDNLFDANQVYKEILKNNIFAIAKTPMAKTITERTLAGYQNFETNVAFIDKLTTRLNKDIDESKNHVMEVFDNLKFDVIIGNPPYNESDNNSGNGSAKPIYAKFIDLAVNLDPKYITLITPSVWFLGGKGLDSFRKRMLKDKHFKMFNVYITANDIFPKVNLRGGVNYFLWDKDFDNREKGVLVNNYKNNELIDYGIQEMAIPNVDIFISSPKGTKILKKLIEQNSISTANFETSDKMLYKYISERNPFGISTTQKLDTTAKYPDDLKVYSSKNKLGFVNSKSIKKNVELIKRYKVLTAFANNIGTDLNDDNLNTIISEPGSVCTESYLVIGKNIELNYEMAQNVSAYIKSKFVRFLISLAKANQNGTRKTYRFVPNQDFSNFSDIDWNSSLDLQLYKKYKLSIDEIKHIEKSIKD